MSRGEVQQRLALLEIGWHRHMVVHYQPDTLDLLEAHRPPHPQIGDVTVRQRASHVVQAMRNAKSSSATMSTSRIS